MKRLISVCLAAVMLLAVGALAVSAEEPIYVFEIRTVNEHIKGEDAVLCTTQEAYDGCGPGWAITILCKIVSANVLEVNEKPVVGSGSIPDVKVGDGVVAMVVHSATSDTSKSDQYPGVFAKVAAMAVKKGQFLKLEGIDLAAGTGSGTATLTDTKPEGSDEPFVPSEEPVESSEEPVESSEEVVEESSEEPAAESSEAPAESSEEPAAESAAESTEESKDGGDGNGVSITTLILIVLAAVVVTAAVVFFLTKGKKAK